MAKTPSLAKSVHSAKMLVLRAIYRHQALIVEPDPNLARPVLMHRYGLIARQSFAEPVGTKLIVPESVQSAVHSHPKIALAIFKQRTNPVGAPIPIQSGCHKVVVLQAA